MIVTVILTLLYAKIRGFRLKPLLKAYCLYPIFLFEIFSLFLQIQIFIGNYEFVTWNTIIKTAYLALYILPVIVYKIYKPALVGSGLIFTGTLLNELVIMANGKKMPVYPSLSKLTGYFSLEALKQSNTHILGTAHSKLIFLSDYIDVGYSILSIGDLMIHFFVAIILFYSIKQLQVKELRDADGT